MTTLLQKIDNKGDRMAKKNKFRRKVARETKTVLITAECLADPGLFLDWDEMTSEARDEFDVNGPIPCEGGGVPGEWCEQCRFGEVDFDREYEP